MKTTIVLLMVFCRFYAVGAACGQIVENNTLENVRNEAIEFLGLCGLDIKNGDVLTVPKECVSRGVKPENPFYRFDIGDDRLTIDATGRIREYLGSLERSSKPPINVELLRDRILCAVLPKNHEVAQPTISEDGARAVHHFFQRTVKGIPVEGQRLRMAFDTQTGDLLYLNNTLEDMEDIDIKLPPAIGYQHAIQQAIETVGQDLNTKRWEGMFDPKTVVLSPLDRPETEKQSRKDLIIAPRNARFHPNGSESSLSSNREKWALAYDIPIEIQPMQGSQRDENFKLFVRVWIDAHSGEVIGGK